MKINIKGHQSFNVTDAIHQYTEEKLKKLLEVFDKITSIDVTLEIEKLEQKAKAHVKLPKGGDVFAEAANKDMYASIDLLWEKLRKQIISYKERLQDHH
ncbi:MAG: ribosome hibernation-promoting factor, HPF/YfiA family [Gammaproteobacteria bacterium]